MSIAIFCVMVLVAFGLMVYSIMHLDNRLYGNVITGILSVILFAILALWSLGGNVIHVDHLMNQTVNETGSFMTAETIQTSYAEPALGFFFALVAVVMFLFSGAMIWDAYHEQIMPNEDREYSEDYK